MIATKLRRKTIFFLNSFIKKRETVTFEQLQMLQVIAFQLVCALELVSEIPESGKRGLACEQTHARLDDINMKVPYALIEAAVDSSLYVVKISKRSKLPVDIYRHA